MTRKRIDLAEILRQRFFSGLHLGVLETGARLPSIRELEAEFDVDRRVVLRAYRELERDGIVELRQRSGIFFGQKPGSPSGLTPPADWPVEILVRGLSLGIPAPRLPEQLAAWTRSRRLRALCVECNFDQLSSLSAEIASDYGFEPAEGDVDELLNESSPRSDLKLADLIVTTQFHSGEVQEIAGRVGCPWIAVSLRTDIYAEIARLLPTSAVYFVVIDERYATKLERIFRPVDSKGNFHSVVVSRDTAGDIPDSAPVYITQAARQRLTHKGLLQRVIPEERTFSLDSAREILTLVVRANMAATERGS